MQPAIHTVHTIEDAPHVAVAMVETWRQRTNEFGNGVHVKMPSETPPTHAEIVAEAISQAIFAELTREYAETSTHGFSGPDENGQYAHQCMIFQYDLAEAQDRNVEMLIPRGDLPTPITHSDIIAWGIANGRLNP